MFRIKFRDVYAMSQKRSFGSLTWWSLGMAFIVFSGITAAFVKIAEEVHEGSTLRYDDAILWYIHHLHNVFFDTFIKMATQLGGLIGVSVLTFICLCFLYWRRKRFAILQLTLSVLGAAAINTLAKGIFLRDRPHLWERIVTETSYSFPSGHAMASSALAFSIILILWHTHWRWWAIVCGGVYVLFIGFTRMYLGVHYPTDILAGWCMSAAWIIVVAVALGVVHVRQR